MTSRTLALHLALSLLAFPTLSCASSTAMPRPASPAKLSAAATDSLRKYYEKDRVETIEDLKSGKTSYLATISRRDFEDRATLTVGSAEDNDVRIADEAVRPHHLRVTVTGYSFRVAAVDEGATFLVRDVTTREATLGPSSIGVGRFTVRLSHQRYPAIIVFDPQSPHFKAFKGLDWFPVDLSYRYELALTPNSSPDTVIVMSTRGNARRAIRAGWFDFAVKGQKCRLEAVRLLEPGVGERDYAVFFRDATTEKETYSVGRYLDPERLPDGRFVLDFNVAYNPACAVSDHYNCPIPSKANRLKVAIRAGEKDSHYH